MWHHKWFINKDDFVISKASSTEENKENGPVSSEKQTSLEKVYNKLPKEMEVISPD